MTSSQTVTGIFSLKPLEIKDNGTKLTNYPADRPDTSYVIPSTVTTIASDAFKDSANLRSITIPSSVTKIEAGAFTGTGIAVIAMPSGVVVEEGAIPDNIIVIRFTISSEASLGGEAILGSSGNAMSVTASMSGSIVNLLISPPAGKVVSSLTASTASGTLNVTGSGNSWSFDKTALGAETEVDLSITLEDAPTGGSFFDNIDPMILIIAGVTVAGGVGAAIFFLRRSGS